MTTALEPRNTPPMGAFDAQDATLARYLGLNPNDPKDRAMIAVCRHYDFDPLLKHVIVIPKGGVYITRDGLLNVAHRSGQLDGIVVEQDPTLDAEAGEWTAKVSVYRKDMKYPFTYPGRYPANGGNKQYAQEMALKAAESHALRRAFDIGGLPSLDEQREEPKKQQRTTVDDLKPATPPSTPSPENAPSAESPVDAEVIEEPSEEPEPATRAQVTALNAAMTDLGITDRASKLAFLSDQVGHEITSSSHLTKVEASFVLDVINGTGEETA